MFQDPPKVAPDAARDLTSIDDRASFGCAPVTLFFVLAFLSASAGAYSLVWALMIHPGPSAWSLFCFLAFTIFTGLAAIALPILLAITRNRT